MPNVCVNHVKIKAVSCVVPENEMCLSDDKTLYNGNEKQLKRVIKSSGFSKRRITDSNTTTADLCQKAAEILLTETQEDRSSIGAVIFVTQTPDYPMPATSCLLAYKLGLTNEIAAFDVNQGCAGFVYALWIGSSLISKECRKVLLLVGDTPSKYTDMFRDGSAPIFGDAGTATLLEYDETAEPLFFNMGTDGSHFDAIISENGGFRNPPTKEKFYDDGSFQYKAKMDGMKVMEFTLNQVPESIRKVLKFANVSPSDIDWFVLHQANKIILKNVALAADLDIDKVPMETLSKFGNQSSASIPCCLCDQLSAQLKTGKHKLVFSGFGIGLSWMSCVATLDKISCSTVHTFEE